MIQDKNLTSWVDIITDQRLRYNEIRRRISATPLMLPLPLIKGWMLGYSKQGMYGAKKTLHQSGGKNPSVVNNLALGDLH